MHKQILFILTLLSTFTYGMEPQDKIINEYVFSQYVPAEDLGLSRYEYEPETITAIKTAIGQKKDPRFRPICTFSYEQKAPMQKAISEALNNKEINRMLIINETDITKTINKDLSTHQHSGTLWNLLYNPNYNPKLNKELTNIDLALYNIDVDSNIIKHEVRRTNIITLLHHLVPTVFIFSGNIDNHKEQTRSLTLDITNIQQKYNSFLHAPEPYCLSQSLTNSSANNLSDSGISSPSSVNPELTSSIISMKLKVERRYLKQKLNLENSVVLDGSVALDDSVVLDENSLQEPISSEEEPALLNKSWGTMSGNEADSERDDL